MRLRWRWTRRGVLLLVDAKRRVYAAVIRAGDSYKFSLHDEDGRPSYHSDASYDDATIAAEEAMTALGL